MGARSYTWSADHTAPVGISDGTLSTSFLYGPEGEKRYQHSSDGTTSASRWFAGEGYELDVSGGVSTTRIYLGDFAVRETTGGITTTRYTLRDHLGSVEVVLDGDATDGTSIYDSVIAYQSFAPFGARRDADWAGAYTDTPPLDEGYTGHQMLDAFNLIHMNGRVYDPTVGRFLSPDILIQAPHFSQSYNRYSYVMNGPMMFVDPSGYMTDCVQAGNCSNVIGLNEMPMVDVSASWHSGATINDLNLGNGYVDGLSSLHSWAQSAQFQMPTLTALQTGSLSSIPMGMPEPTRNNTFMSGLLTRTVDESVQAAVDLGMYSLLGASYVTSGGIEVGSLFAPPSTNEAQLGYDLGVLLPMLVTRRPGALGQTSSAWSAMPNRLARVVDARFGNSARLAGPGADDVFVTAADDIAGITNSADLARRLTLLDDAGRLRSGPFTVIEFNNPVTGIASPVFRMNPGFLQGGVTRGGAREFVLSNGQVRDLTGVTRRVVE